MFRALTYPLILAVAVGPLLCCCTLGRTVAATAPQPASAKAVRNVPAASHACCAHKTSRNAKGTDPKPAPGKSEPGKSCPCKDGSAHAKVIPAAPQSHGTAELLRVASLDLVLPGSTAASATLALVGGGDFAHGLAGRGCAPSTSDLLFAHHKLRC